MGLRRVGIIIGNGANSCERHDATPVATGDFDEYAVYAELRGHAAQLDGEPRWRFRPAARVSLLKLPGRQRPHVALRRTDTWGCRSAAACPRSSAVAGRDQPGSPCVVSRVHTALRAHSSINLIYDTRPLFRARFHGADRRMFNPADELCIASYRALRPSRDPVVEAGGCARGPRARTVDCRDALTSIREVTPPRMTLRRSQADQDRGWKRRPETEGVLADHRAPPFAAVVRAASGSVPSHD
jgi:hypothetical protein